MHHQRLQPQRLLPKIETKVSDPQGTQLPLPSLRSEKTLRCLLWGVGGQWCDHLQELEKEEQVLLEETERVDRAETICNDETLTQLGSFP